MAVRKKTTRKKAAKKKVRKSPVSDTPKKPLKKKGGRPEFKTTGEQRHLVEALVGYGMTYKEICCLVKNPTTGEGISINTLQRHFREELDAGAPKVKAKVVQSLVKSACAGNVTAQIWFTKARLGWKGDHVIHEVEGKTGVLVVPALTSVEDFITQMQKDNENAKSPADD